MSSVVGLVRVSSSFQLQQLRSLSKATGARLLKLSSSATVQRRLKSEPPKKNETETRVADRDLHRSVLEEVLIKEKKAPTTFTGKVAEKAENTFLYAVVAGSVALLGVFGYFLFDEFFAKDSPQLIFSKALSMVQNDGRCQDMFGDSIKGFGEETSRGRRRHVAHHKYEKDGKQRIRVMFHVKGDRDEGTAQVEMEYRDGVWEYRFLIVETKSRPRTTHVMIDNRLD